MIAEVNWSGGTGVLLTAAIELFSPSKSPKYANMQTRYFYEWINKQKRANEIVFLPYQSGEAQELFPELNTLDPAREMVVRTDTGEIYRAAEAWVWCLWSCEKYRGVAKKFSSPALLPHVQKLCHMLAANRITLSKLFFRKKSKQEAAQLHAMPSAECDDDNCKIQ